MCRGLQWLHIYLEMDLGATDIDAAGLAKDVVRKPRGQARPPEPADLVLLGRTAREWQGCSRYCALVITALPRSGVRPNHAARSVLESVDDAGAWFLYPLNYNRDPECLASICRWLLSFERTHFDDDHLSLGHSAGQGSAQSAHVKICRLLGKTLDVKPRPSL